MPSSPPSGVPTSGPISRAGTPCSSAAGRPRRSWDRSRAGSSALGSRVPVLVRTKEELEAIIESNPFVHRGEDPKVLHVTFMGALPRPEAVASVPTKTVDADELQVTGREIYLFCPHGYGKTKLTNAFFEKKLGSSATTRNWKTVTTLVELASG